MAKKIKVIVAQGIKVGGKYPEIGREIDLDDAEAKRLLALGAVELPKVKVEEETGAKSGQQGKDGGKSAGKGSKGGESKVDDAALLEKVNAAQTLEELKALLPEQEPSEAVAEAIQKRWTELEEAGE